MAGGEKAHRRGSRSGSSTLAGFVKQDSARRYRWVILLVAIVSLILAVTDSFFGSIRLALVSSLWVAIIVAELLWWPGKLGDSLSNAERAEMQARQVLADVEG